MFKIEFNGSYHDFLAFLESVKPVLSQSTIMFCASGERTESIETACLNAARPFMTGDTRNKIFAIKAVREVAVKAGLTCDGPDDPNSLASLKGAKYFVEAKFPQSRT